MATTNVSIMDSGLCSKALGRKSANVAISKGASSNRWNFYSTSYSRQHRMENFKRNPQLPMERTTGYSSNEHGYIPYTKELDEHDGATINLEGTYESVTKSSYDDSDLVWKSGREKLPSNVPVCAESGFNKGITATLPLQAHVYTSQIHEEPKKSTTRSDFVPPTTLVPASSWVKDGTVGTQLTQKDIGLKTETGFSNNRNAQGQGRPAPCVSFTKHEDNELHNFIGQAESVKNPNAEDTTYTTAYPAPDILTGKEPVPHLTPDVQKGTKPTGFTRSVNNPVFIGERIKAENVTRADQLPLNQVQKIQKTAPAEFFNLTKGTKSSMYMASFVNKSDHAPKKIVNNQVQIGMKEPTGSVRNTEIPIDRNLTCAYETENKQQFYDRNEKYRRGFNPQEKIKLYHNAYSRSAVINKFKDPLSFRDEMADRHRAQREAFQTRNPAYYEEPHLHKQHNSLW